MAYKNSDTSSADAAEPTLSLLGNLASAPSLVSSIDLTSLQQNLGLDVLTISPITVAQPSAAFIASMQV